MRFHLTVVRPEGEGRFYSQSFHEVIECLAYGLIALGHEVSQKTNVFITLPGATNIVLGPHLLDPKNANFPPNTILYNLEQCGANPKHDMSPDLYTRYRIWDYSPANIEYWRSHGISAQHVPVGHMPQLTRIQPTPVQDIDVLFYGSISERRRNILNQLDKVAGLRLFCIREFGRLRDAAIARSKVILNLHYYDRPQLFEQPRVAYLLSNMKAVVCERSDDFPAALRDALCEVDYDNLVRACCALVKDVDGRYRMQERGYRIFSRMREKDILKQALQFCTESTKGELAAGVQSAQA